ncbi:MAG: ABC transporter permease [Lachnospiraceae bacterium]|nr:ABC transporter permease [Lachnospiraceae bacterium]
MLLAIILTLIGIKAVSGLDAENLAKRWSKEDDFAQVSCYFSQLSKFNKDSVLQLNGNIEKKLKGDSLTTDKENARSWVHAYSANGQAQVSYKKTSASFKAVGVGGDYFLFHPLKLVHGNYFSDSFVGGGIVLIDTDVAWQLFGSSDVVGQLIDFNGEPYVICGVVERESGRINDLAGNNKATIYVPYSALEANESTTFINMYEALLPNPISGYAVGALTDALKTDKDTYELVENTGRFHWTKLVANVKNFGIRGMNGKAIIYPYWENMARGMEDYLTPVAVAALILYAVPIVFLIMLIFRMWKKRTIHFSDLKNFVDDRIDKRRAKKYYEKQLELKEIE